MINKKAEEAGWALGCAPSLAALCLTLQLLESRGLSRPHPRGLKAPWLLFFPQPGNHN